MKKLSLTLLALAATTLAYGETYYPIPADGMLFDGGTSPLISDTIIQGYDGFTGGVVTVEASEQMTVGNFNRDFTFNGIVLNNTASKTVNFDFKITNGATLTFNNQMEYGTASTTRYAFYGDPNRGNVVINTTFSKSGGSMAGGQEFWMDRVDVVYNGGGTMGYTHFFNGATLKITKDVVMTTLAFRKSTEMAGDVVDFGTLTIDKSTVQVNSFTWNAGGSTAGKGNFFINFNDTNAAEVFAFNIGDGTISSMITNDLHILFEGFGTNDKIYSTVDMVAKMDSIVIVNGSTLSSLIANGTIEVTKDSLNGTNYGYVYSLVAVPEPATYAAIFGALALGFAMYRRRK